MARCKHAHVEITRYRTVLQVNYGCIEHTATPWKNRVEDSDPSWDQGIRVICCDCGYSKEFADGAKKPKWIKAWEQVLYPQNS